MLFNASKFQLIRMGPNLPLIQTTHLYIDSPTTPLVPVQEVKDLGIIIDNNGNFKAQRLAATAKAQRKAAWVLRTFTTRKPEILATLWRSLVQPNLDYCSQLWSPVDLPGPLREMEEPLKAYTRRIIGCKDLNYWERLKKLRMSSIQRRFER